MLGLGWESIGVFFEGVVVSNLPRLVATLSQAQGKPSFSDSLSFWVHRCVLPQQEDCALLASFWSNASVGRKHTMVKSEGCGILG